MAHIRVQEGFPGIVGPLKTFPHTGKVLNELAEQLLVNDTPTFPKSDREMIAAYVSYLNKCVFCSESHASVANFHARQPGLAQSVWKNTAKAKVSDRLKAFLNIAKKVQKDARKVTKKDIDTALKHGATERDVHDAVLIASAFCMYNRYVDGLATFTPKRGDQSYDQMGKMLGTGGYRNAA